VKHVDEKVFYGYIGADYLTVSSLMLSLINHKGLLKNKIVIPARYRKLAEKYLPALNVNVFGSSTGSQLEDSAVDGKQTEAEKEWENEEVKEEWHSKFKRSVLRVFLAQLLQLLTPEAAFIAREKLPADYVEFYLDEQQHFRLHEFIEQATTLLRQDEAARREQAPATAKKDKGKEKEGEDKVKDRSLWVYAPATSKYVIYTRSNSLQRQEMQSDDVQVLSLADYQQHESLRQELMRFTETPKQTLIVTVDTHLISTERINHVRLLVEDVEKRFELAQSQGGADVVRRKLFLIVLQIPGRNMYTQKPCYPAVFLNGWDFMFVDSCSSHDLVDVRQWQREIIKQEQGKLQQGQPANEETDKDNDKAVDASQGLTASRDWSKIVRKPLESYLDKALEYVLSKLTFGKVSTEIKDKLPVFYRQEQSVRKRVRALREFLQDHQVLQQAMSKFLAGIWKGDLVEEQMQESCQQLLTDKVSLSLSETLNNIFMQVEKHFLLWFIQLIGERFNLVTLTDPEKQSAAPNEEVVALFGFKLANERVPSMQELALLANAAWDRREVQVVETLPRFPFFDATFDRINQIMQMSIERLALKKAADDRKIYMETMELLGEDGYLSQVTKLPSDLQETLWHHYAHDAIDKYVPVLQLGGDEKDIVMRYLDSHRVSLADDVNTYPLLSINMALLRDNRTIARYCLLTRPFKDLGYSHPVFKPGDLKTFERDLYEWFRTFIPVSPSDLAPQRVSEVIERGRKASMSACIFRHRMNSMLRMTVSCPIACIASIGKMLSTAM
jgi:hypothetical protein